MKGLWRAEVDHPYGEGAIISTLATVLRLLPNNAHLTPQQLVEQARQRWDMRDTQRFG
jgi:hypothetical protein